MLVVAYRNARRVISDSTNRLREIVDLVIYVASGRVVNQQLSRIQKYWHSLNRVSLSRKHLTVVTGCDSGLGYSIAVRSSNRGSSVIAGVLDVNGPGAKALAEREGVRVLPLDLTNGFSREKFTRSIFEIVQAEDLKLHAFVNNAGIMIFGMFDWLLSEHIERQHAVNILGPQLLTRELVQLIRKDQARVINVSSHCAASNLPGLSVYSSTKAALEAWTCALRIEFKNFSSKVIIFVPGSFFMSSNLMAHQIEFFNKMSNSMGEEERQFYGDFFKRYTEHLRPLVKESSYDLMQDDAVLSVFEGALLDKRPSHKYKYESLRYKVFHFLFAVTPVTVRDWLVVKFMTMPTFK